MPKKTSKVPIRNIIVVSDTHFGSKLALISPEGAELDDGGLYMPSRLQLKLWEMWLEFWESWVPQVTHGEPYCVVHNGDVIEGVHHGDTTNWSANPKDQCRHAEKVLKPVVDACDGRFYLVRGTEAHSGKSCQEEESMGKNLGAIPNEDGQFARWELWLRVGGATGPLCHFLHHIGTTSSAAHETSAVNAELAAMYAEAGRYSNEPPRIVVRSHRHRSSEVRMPNNDGYAACLVTAAWQLKTPFAYKVAGARVTTPQIGGALIRLGDEELYTRLKVWNIERSKIEEV